MECRERLDRFEKIDEIDNIKGLSKPFFGNVEKDKAQSRPLLIQMGNTAFVLAGLHEIVP